MAGRFHTYRGVVTQLPGALYLGPDGAAYRALYILRAEGIPGEPSLMVFQHSSLPQTPVRAMLLETFNRQFTLQVQAEES